MKENSIVVFEENEGWCNIIGKRNINKLEYDSYVLTKEKNTLDYLINSFSFSSEEKKISIDYEITPEVKNNPDRVNWIVFRGLHVHHNYYQKGRLPWEYPDEALITLCWYCHEELHANEKVPYYDENMRVLRQLTPCSRCHGAGVFPEYNHIQNGICFKCYGVRYEEFIKRKEDIESQNGDSTKL